MDVVSYRGPGAAGGVSTGLASAWRNNHQDRTQWWFISGEELKVLTPGSDDGRFITLLSEPLVQGHYHYCNDFVWPIMHDLAEHATYKAEDRAAYRRFNLRFAEHIATEQRYRTVYFVQDYQLALLPSLLRKTGSKSQIFWHIPWPKSIPDEFAEPIAELARGILSAHRIGFHTQEYVENFLAFVRDNLSEYTVDERTQTARPISGRSAPSLIETPNLQALQPYVLRPYASSATHSMPTEEARVEAMPLGIDMAFWRQLGQDAEGESLDRVLPEHVLDKRIVLSVDRADYTKAVVERLQIIDQLLTEHQEYRDRVSFVQICGRSRAGLEAFDRYWHICQSLRQRINERWGTESWTPIYSIETPLEAKELAALYRRADAMLVTPVRDGLNLTAKEYAACQGPDPGALLLSPQAGAWHEIGKYCLPAHPHDAKQVIDSIRGALSMPISERRARNGLTRAALEKSNLQSWWRHYSRAAHAAGADRVVSARRSTARERSA